ncbi:MAG TPA: PAS domain S-box protein [Thermoanaerobaculia bacterium]|nr:PAS domain S-box protein [Thermoanaerobaculia bacterium]
MPTVLRNGALYLLLAAVPLALALLFRNVLGTLLPYLSLLGVAALLIVAVMRNRSNPMTELEKRCRKLVEFSPEGIAMLDDAATIVFANPAFAQILGTASPATLAGKNVLELTHADDRERARAQLAEIAAGQPVSWTERRWIRFDGTTIHVEVAAVRIVVGDQRFVQVMVRDITERLATQAGLEASRRRLQALFDAAIDGVMFFDSEGRYVDANPAASRILGYSREDLVRRKIGDFVPDATRERGRQILAGTLARGEVVGHTEVVSGDGTRHQTDYRTRANVVDGVHVLVFHDVTGQNEAEKAVQDLSRRLLRVQDEERRRLGRELHDHTAQHLAALRMNLVVAQRGAAASEPRVAEALADSMALTDQAIAEIRTLSYLLHPPLIDEAGLSAALRWYVKGFESRSGIAVSLEVPEETVRLPRDVETTIFRIVQEALTNIQRHSGSASAQIRLVHGEQMVHLEISDAGKGLPDALRGSTDALFASGVGMAGMRQRVGDMSGTLAIQSDDRGTTIAITLPITE